MPDFAPGDTLRVAVKVVEGERTRTQAFEGVCIARSNKGLNSNFTVRKISYGEGVERVFPLYAPTIAEIAVVRRGDVRRAKLYYLRGRRGKSARIAEKARVIVPGDAGRAAKPPLPPRRSNRGRWHAKREEQAMSATKPRTLFDKIWDSHVVDASSGRHLRPLHRPPPRPRGHQPAGLRGAARWPAARCAAPDATIAVADHNIPTVGPRAAASRKRTAASRSRRWRERRRVRRALYPDAG